MRVENWSIEKLTPYARNPRKNDHAVLKVAASIKEYGWRQPIVVDKDGVVVAGHTRLLAAMHLKQKTVPVHIADELNPIQVKAYRLADNRVAQEAEWDDELLALEIEELQALGLSDLDSLGFEEEELAGLHVPELEETEGLTDPDEVPEPPADPITKPGDLWLLGRHRLLCGDSTKAEDVARLMDGEMADMVFTSPPYNSGGNSGTGGYRCNEKRKFKEFYNECADNWTSEDYRKFLWDVLNHCGRWVTNDAPILWNVMYNANSRDDYGHVVFSNQHPFTVQETIIWDKNVGMNITGTGILSRSAELIFLMAKDKYYTNQNMEVFWNVWRISNKGGGNMEHGHGASFPEGLPNEAISKFCRIGGLIYEPFLGSGTTLIAAEKTGRKCYGMEISPAYCDVIVKRWEDFTGEKAVLADG